MHSIIVKRSSFCRLSSSHLISISYRILVAKSRRTERLKVRQRIPTPILTTSHLGNLPVRFFQRRTVHFTLHVGLETCLCYGDEERAQKDEMQLNCLQRQAIFGVFSQPQDILLDFKSFLEQARSAQGEYMYFHVKKHVYVYVHVQVYVYHTTVFGKSSDQLHYNFHFSIHQYVASSSFVLAHVLHVHFSDEERRALGICSGSELICIRENLHEICS